MQPLGLDETGVPLAPHLQDPREHQGLPRAVDPGVGVQEVPHQGRPAAGDPAHEDHLAVAGEGGVVVSLRLRPAAVKVGQPPRELCIQSYFCRNAIATLREYGEFTWQLLRNLVVGTTKAHSYIYDNVSPQPFNSRLSLVRLVKGRLDGWVPRPVGR